jgi:anhydro-N-acetylmuramic acid kinase
MERAIGLMSGTSRNGIDAAVIRTDGMGWDGNATEAQGFAYLAYRCLHGLPISYPQTTGVPEPMSGGMLAKPRNSMESVEIG